MIAFVLCITLHTCVVVNLNTILDYATITEVYWLDNVTKRNIHDNILIKLVCGTFGELHGSCMLDPYYFIELSSKETIRHTIDEEEG